MGCAREIYLIRHGMPALDGAPVYLGRTDLPLSEQGRRQAQHLAETLRGRVGAVYCSPLRRCVETAQAISTAPILMPGLAEIDMGAWEMVPRAEIRRNFPALYEARGRDLAGFLPPEGESFAQCATRAWAAFRTLLRESEGDVAVVAHSGVNRTILCRVTGHPLGRLMEFSQPYCGVTRLRLSLAGLALVIPELERGGAS